MITSHVSTKDLGDLVAASYDVGSAIAHDPKAAAELAGRHLERVLVRGANLRLMAALKRLSRELGPTVEEARSPGRSIATAR
jgi:hypothetical protein